MISMDPPHIHVRNEISAWEGEREGERRGREEGGVEGEGGGKEEGGRKEEEGREEEGRKKERREGGGKGGTEGRREGGRREGAIHIIPYTRTHPNHIGQMEGIKALGILSVTAC